MYMLIFVDDISLIENNQSHVDQVVRSLGAKFELKDLGPLHFVLGIEVIHHPFGIVLSQQRYIIDLLRRTGLSDAKPASVADVYIH